MKISKCSVTNCFETLITFEYYAQMMWQKVSGIWTRADVTRCCTQTTVILVKSWSKHAEISKSERRDIFTESQNGRGWKGPLWVI